MKRIMALALSAAMFFSGTAYAAAAYNTPFERNTLGCSEYRIPALLTLKDGSVCASADMRWSHGKDSPQNIDTVFAKSSDGLGDWKYTVVNRFDDYADGESSANSASFIDSALLQSDNGTLYMLTEAYMSGIGIMNTKKGSGCIEINGKKYISLTEKGKADYKSYISDFENGFAPVIKNGKATGYSVDEEYRLYKNGVLLTMPQLDRNEKPTGKKIAQSVFYSEADYHVFETPFLWLRSSTDGGETWSSPVILNSQVTSENDYFLGACPGRGISVTVNGKERLIFTVYHSNAGGDEKAMTIYSDDGGITWNRGEEVKNSVFTGKTSESQIIELPDGTLRMFSRNSSNYTASCDSTDGGVTFSKSFAEQDMYGTKNCMVSFINCSRKINGKDVIISSSGSSPEGRANGAVRVFGVNEDNSFNMLSEYHVNRGFYAYSCLTELENGNIALLYEDEASHINYMVLSLDESGRLSEINGQNIAFDEEESFSQKIKKFFDKIWFLIENIINV